MKSAYLFVYNKDKYANNAPTSWKDFFDTKNFPGKRGIMDYADQGALVIALVADGVDLGDVEATERKMQLKQRDSGIERKVLLLNDTRHNRAVVDATPELRESFPMRTREVLGALGQGQDPGGDGIVFL